MGAYLSENSWIRNVLGTFAALFAVVAVPIGADNYLDETYVQVAQFKGFIQREWKEDIRDLKIDIRKETDPGIREMLEDELDGEIEDYCLEYPGDRRLCGDDR